MRNVILVSWFAMFSFGLMSCGETEPDPEPVHEYPLDDELRLHHVQVRGTHNSYHVEPETVIHPSHAYSHAPLDVQLETQGVRTFELDLHRMGDTFDVFHLANQFW